MKESEILWNEDELLTQMEQMQDQIDQLGREKDQLIRDLAEKNTRMEELEQTSSFEISKLQSALQQAQKKLQEQSAQIVTLSSADLILKDNERLKEDNARLQREKENSEKEAARVKEACKRKLQKNDEDLRQKIQDAEKKEAQARERERQADGLARNREVLISEKVSSESDRIEKRLAEQYSKLIGLLRNDFFRKEKKAERRQVVTSVYALLLAVFLACRSETYMKSLTGSVMQIRDGIVFCWGVLYKFTGKAADICGIVALPFSLGILHRLIFAIVIIISCIIISGLLFGMTRWTWRRFHTYLKLWRVMMWTSEVITVSVLSSLLFGHFH